LLTRLGLVERKNITFSDGDVEKDDKRPRHTGLTTKNSRQKGV